MSSLYAEILIIVRQVTHNDNIHHDHVGLPYDLLLPGPWTAPTLGPHVCILVFLVGWHFDNGATSI